MQEMKQYPSPNIGRHQALNFIQIFFLLTLVAIFKGYSSIKQLYTSSEFFMKLAPFYTAMDEQVSEEKYAFLAVSPW